MSFNVQLLDFYNLESYKFIKSDNEDIISKKILEYINNGLKIEDIDNLDLKILERIEENLNELEIQEVNDILKYIIPSYVYMYHNYKQKNFSMNLYEKKITMNSECESELIYLANSIIVTLLESICLSNDIELPCIDYHELINKNEIGDVVVIGSQNELYDSSYCNNNSIIQLIKLIKSYSIMYFVPHIKNYSKYLKIVLHDPNVHNTRKDYIQLNHINPEYNDNFLDDKFNKYINYQKDNIQFLINTQLNFPEFPFSQPPHQNDLSFNEVNIGEKKVLVISTNIVHLKDFCDILTKIKTKLEKMDITYDGIIQIFYTNFDDVTKTIDLSYIGLKFGYNILFNESNYKDYMTTAKCSMLSNVGYNKVIHYLNYFVLYNGDINVKIQSYENDVRKLVKYNLKVTLI